MATKYWIGVLTVIILISGIAILLPDKVRIDVQKTRTLFKVYENESWVLSATEYVNLFDGSAKMRAKSRSLELNEIDGIITINRRALYKDGIYTVEDYIFDSRISDVELTPISHTMMCYNCKGKILQFEYKDITYEGNTQVIESPFNFGHNMKLEWQEGYDWAKVYQYKTVSPKIRIRYRPESDFESYEIRLFDPEPKEISKIIETSNSITINQLTKEIARYIKYDENYPVKIKEENGTYFAEYNPIDLNETKLLAYANTLSSEDKQKITNKEIPIKDFSKYKIKYNTTYDKGELVSNVSYKEYNITTYDYSKPFKKELSVGITKFGINSTIIELTNVSVGVFNQSFFNDTLDGVVINMTDFNSSTYITPVINLSNNGTIKAINNITFACDEPSGTNCSASLDVNTINNSPDLFTDEDGLYFFSNEFEADLTVTNQEAVQNYAGGLGSLLSNTQDSVGLTSFVEDGLHIGQLGNSGDCVDISNHGVSCISGCTVIMRFKLDNLASGKRFWSQQNDHWDGQLSSAQKIRMFAGAGGVVDSTDAIIAERWYWVGFNWAGNDESLPNTRNESLWIDGKLNNSAISTKNVTSTADYKIGGGSLCRKSINMTVSHFMLFNRSLIDSEMAYFNDDLDWTTCGGGRNFTNPTLFTGDECNATFAKIKVFLETNGSNTPVYFNSTIGISDIGEEPPPEDTCTTGLTDGIFDCADNCNIGTLDLLGLNFVLTGDGTFRGNIFNYSNKTITSDNSCIAWTVGG